MKQSLGGSTEAAFSFVEASAGIGNRGGGSSSEPRLVSCDKAPCAVAECSIGSKKSTKSAKIRNKTPFK